jgi:DNA-binding XRE family transcriptional regulator
VNIRNTVYEYPADQFKITDSMKVRMLKSFRAQQNELFLALLRDRREALGLRQSDLAQRLGESQVTVSRVENGDRRLDVIELRAWLRALKLGFVPFVRQLDRKLKDQAPPDVPIVRATPAKRGSLGRRGTSS